MSLSLNDSIGNPVESSFSLSVRDAGTEIYTSYQDNILTDLLLSSDIKGYVANPMQYFESHPHEAGFTDDGSGVVSL